MEGGGNVAGALPRRWNSGLWPATILPMVQIAVLSVGLGVVVVLGRNAGGDGRSGGGGLEYRSRRERM